jgi:predicted enzyme related to lactoylglutathione lyase
VLYSDDLKKCYADIVAAGGNIAEPIFAFTGGRRFHFFEPSGNELAI